MAARARRWNRRRVTWRHLSSAALRVPALEDAALRLAKSAEEQAERVATAEDARSRVEIALAAALVELDRTRRAGAEGDAEGDRALAVRVRELEGLVRALEADSFAMAETHARELTAMEERLRRASTLGGPRSCASSVGGRPSCSTWCTLSGGGASVSGGPHAEAGADGGRGRRGGTRDGASGSRRGCRAPEEVDEAALEIARREGESATAAWRIQELEQAIGRGSRTSRAS